MIHLRTLQLPKREEDFETSYIKMKKISIESRSIELNGKEKMSSKHG